MCRYRQSDEWAHRNDDRRSLPALSSLGPYLNPVGPLVPYGRSHRGEDTIALYLRAILRRRAAVVKERARKPGPPLPEYKKYKPPF